MFEIDITDIEPTIDDAELLDCLTEIPIFDSIDMPQGDTTIGDPNKLECEFQIRPDNCAVEAERSIINIFLDSPLTQQEAIYISSSHGWYQPGVGTSQADIGQMMDTYNIPNHTVVNASVTDLAGELAQGHGIIVGVDSEELWDTGLLAELKQWLSNTFGIDFGDTGANHAVVVTGIDVTDPNNPMVIINDSGVPNGQGQPYPMDKFLHAWEDSNCYYTATDVPLPDRNLVASQGDFSMVMADVLGDLVGGFAGGFVGGATLSSTGDPISALLVGIDTYQVTDNLVEDFFADANAIAEI